jgi:hypothetical protein
MARACRDDLPDAHSEIFLRKGLDGPNQLELVGEIRVCAHSNSGAFEAIERRAITPVGQISRRTIT